MNWCIKFIFTFSGTKIVFYGIPGILRKFDFPVLHFYNMTGYVTVPRTKLEKKKLLLFEEKKLLSRTTKLCFDQWGAVYVMMSS